MRRIATWRALSAKPVLTSGLRESIVVKARFLALVDALLLGNDGLLEFQPCTEEPFHPSATRKRPTLSPGWNVRIAPLVSRSVTVSPLTSVPPAIRVFERGLDRCGPSPRVERANQPRVVAERSAETRKPRVVR